MANSYDDSVAQASPKPSVIFCQKSAGVQPSSPNPIIIFDIIPDIMLDIILGIPLLAINTTIPPISAPIDPISMYFNPSRFCEACMIFSLYLLAMEAVKMNYSMRSFGGITILSSAAPLSTWLAFQESHSRTIASKSPSPRGRLQRMVMPSNHHNSLSLRRIQELGFVRSSINLIVEISAISSGDKNSPGGYLTRVVASNSEL